MYQVSLQELSTDHVIARSIFRPNGEMLLAKGYRMTNQVLKKLPDIGQELFWVLDEELEGEMSFDDLVSEQILNFSSNKLFENANELRNELKSNELTLDEIKKQAEDTSRFKDAIAIVHVQDSAVNMISEIMASKAVLLNISSLRSKSQYVYQNVVDTTVTSLMIARKFGFKPHEMEELAMGALLMDTGYLIMPEELVNRVGRVTYEEYQLLKEHPEYGFKILRENPKLPLISTHVAYQHHECQDGTGYPRELSGTHTPPISGQQYDKTHIHRYAEIASVAESYIRLSNPKPGLRAPSPYDVIKVLIKSSRSRLNRSIVDKLIGIIPIYPVGSRVVVSANAKDQYLGYTGIVSDSNPNNVERPIVHLLFNQEKAKVKPIKISLEEYPDVQIMHKRLN